MNLKNKPTFKSGKIRVGVTMGDPSGVGPIITLKALRKLKGMADFVLIGNRHILKSAQCARFVHLDNLNSGTFRRGVISPEYGRASIEYLDKALDLLKDKQIDCLVTAPISKEAINKAGFVYAGHTEYFLKKSKVGRAEMLLLNDCLKFSLVTRHLALKDVPQALTRDSLYSNIITTHESLKSLFGIKKPSIVVCGLNPHASDNGLIGDEENRVIKPVLSLLKNKAGLKVEGPFSSDAAIYRARNNEYDCVIAIYHDQALIPLKLTGLSSGVNMTLGLPFIRTSPLHGTAFDIANSPKKANPDSMIAAIKLAVKCALIQKRA